MVDDIWERTRSFHANVGVENTPQEWSTAFLFHRVVDYLGLQELRVGHTSMELIDILYDNHKVAIEAELIKRRLKS